MGGGGSEGQTLNWDPLGPGTGSIESSDMADVESSTIEEDLALLGFDLDLTLDLGERNFPDLSTLLDLTLTFETRFCFNER